MSEVIRGPMQRKGTGQHDLPWGPCCQPTGPCLCQQPGGRGLRGRLCLQPSSQRSHLPSPGHVHDRWPQVTPSLPRACTVVTGHTSPQGACTLSGYLLGRRAAAHVQCPLPPERGHGAGATGRLSSSRRFTELPSGLHSYLQTSVHCPA